MHQLIVVVDGQGLADTVEKVMGGQHAAVILQLGAGAIVDAVKLVPVRDPGLAEAREPV
ncbi:hypothetical protein D3C76_1683460 [compost metagenome]